MADNLAAQLRDSLRAATGRKRYQVIVRGGDRVPRAAITLYASSEQDAEAAVAEWVLVMDPTAYVDEVAELA